MKKSKPCKRCSECNKVIASHNKSGLCAYHNKIKLQRDSYRKNNNKKKWKEHKCL